MSEAVTIPTPLSFKQMFPDGEPVKAFKLNLVNAVLAESPLLPFQRELAALALGNRHVSQESRNAFTKFANSVNAEIETWKATGLKKDIEDAVTKALTFNEDAKFVGSYALNVAKTNADLAMASFLAKGDKTGMSLLVRGIIQDLGGSQGLNYVNHMVGQAPANRAV